MKSTDDAKSTGTQAFRSVSLAILLVTSVSLAGCSGIPFLGGGEESVNAPNELTQKLEVSPSTIYERVEEMTGIEAEYPAIEMYYRTADDIDTNRSFPSLRVLAGPLPSSETTRVVSDWGYDPIDEVVYVNHSFYAQSSQEQLQTAIAGAFYQSIMIQQNWTEYDPRARQYVGPISDLSDVDSMMPTTLIAGSTNYVQQAYANEYLDGADIEIAPEWEEDTSIYGKMLTSAPRSPVGLQYFQGALDSPAGLQEFFTGEVPVRTTEQLIHDTDDEPSEIQVNLESGNWWQARDPDPLGELGTRMILAGQLSPSEAEAAAAGWGNDELAALQSHYGNNTRGIVWTHRWDSASEADEYANAIQTFIEGRESERDDVTFELQRPEDDATILVAGSNNFLDLVDVSYDDYAVNVTIGNV